MKNRKYLAYFIIITQWIMIACLSVKYCFSI
jgi:hypothetical protein